jgi:AraC-like DNA-binding protein
MKIPARRVPARYFVLLRDALQRQGFDTSRWLQMSGVEEKRLDVRDAKLLPSEVEAMIASARRLFGRTDLAFELGLQVKANSHDLLGYGMISCRNFDEVLRLVVRHYHLMVETVALRYQRSRTRERGEAIYTQSFAMPLETLRFYYEVLAVSHHNQLRQMSGGDFPPYDIYLSMPEPPHAARYNALAPARFHFDEGGVPGVRVVMGADLLDKPLPLADPRVVQEVDERCSALGQRPPAGDTGWGDYVTMMLRQSHGELVTLNDLAQRISISARTIDRHLRKEDRQFRDLAQQVRFERACELLAVPGTTVAQAAVTLGFSDATNLSRAFRRVIGITPSEYQQRLASVPQAQET